MKKHYNNLLDSIRIERGIIQQEIKTIEKKIANYKTRSIVSSLYGYIDLTSLNTDDNDARIIELVNTVNNRPSTTSVPPVAGICVYPRFIETVKQHLTVPDVKVVAVGASFPASQTFLSVKLAEIELMVKKGVDEIDVVLPVGELLAGHYETVSNELKLIKETCGDKHLKVILETGAYTHNYELIYLASLLSMESGADFIKTSTGKINISATPEAVFVMAMAINDYYKKTGRPVGIKPAGGISTTEDALLYYIIVETILGKQWLTPALFRIGASRLAQHIINDLKNL